MRDVGVDFDDRFEVDIIEYQRERIDQKRPNRSCQFVHLFSGNGIKACLKSSTDVYVLKPKFRILCESFLHLFDSKRVEKTRLVTCPHTNLRFFKSNQNTKCGTWAQMRYKLAKIFRNIVKYSEKFLRVYSAFIAGKHPEHRF